MNGISPKVLRVAELKKSRRVSYSRNTLARAPDDWPRSGASRIPMSYDTENFSSLIAAKSLTSPPTRFDA